jgi:hypothetical protein
MARLKNTTVKELMRRIVNLEYKLDEYRNKCLGETELPEYLLRDYVAEKVQECMDDYNEPRTTYRLLRLMDFFPTIPTQGRNVLQVKVPKHSSFQMYSAQVGVGTMVLIFGYYIQNLGLPPTDVVLNTRVNTINRMWTFPMVVNHTFRQLLLQENQYIRARQCDLLQMYIQNDSDNDFEAAILPYGVIIGPATQLMM